MNARESRRWLDASFEVAQRWPDLRLPEGLYPALRAALARSQGRV